jgi:hypothetical protein
MARVLVLLDVTDADAADKADLVNSILARVEDEAGYLNNGMPIQPSSVIVTLVDDDVTPLDPDLLRGVYEVGIEGAR